MTWKSIEFVCVCLILQKKIKNVQQTSAFDKKNNMYSLKYVGLLLLHSIVVDCSNGGTRICI